MRKFFTLFMLMSFAFGLNAQFIYNDYDDNQNITFFGWENNPVLVANPDPSGINTSANVAQYDRTWQQYSNVYTNTLPGAIDFTTGTIFSIKVYSPIACDVLFKLENGAGAFTERLLSITTPNTWVQLDFDFTGEASETYDKIVIFFDFATWDPNTYYFDEVEGPNYVGSVGKPLLATDVQDNFEDNGWGTINDWIFQNPGMDPLPTTADPVDAANTVADYNRTGAFEWANAQAELDHRMDLTNRNVFEMRVYFPSSNDYTGALTPTAAIKLQNSLLGGDAWTTQTVVSQTVTDFDQWVTLTFDFSSASENEDYDKIVIQFGGEGHWVPGQFYFDDLELLPWYAETPYTYNNFDEIQNVEFTGWPNGPVLVSNPDASGINTSANVGEWVRTTEQYAHMYTILDGPINFDEGTNFQFKIYSPIVCNVLFKLEDQNNSAVFVQQSMTVWDLNEWAQLNFDFPDSPNGTYDKIIIFIDFESTTDNTFYIDDITGPNWDGNKPVLELNVQDNFEDDGWGTIEEWIFQDPAMDPLVIVTDPEDATNHVADYNRSGTFEWTNAQTILNHRMDLSERNKFELSVYFPSTNDYTGSLTPTAAIKLQNSLLGGMAWTTQTEVVQTVTEFDQWVTLLFDFEAVKDSINYDQIVVQLGGEGHWTAAQFYFDDLYLKHVPYITVESPNGGEMLDQGSYFDIEWDYDYWEGDVKIELLKTDTEPQLLAIRPASDTVFSWFVFADLEPASDYKIAITSNDDVMPTDTSDATFTVVLVDVLVSNFTAEPTIFSTADSTLFTDQTTGSPSSWVWTFEGGTPATYEGQNPPYIHYDTPGTYDVTLVVTNDDGSDTMLKEDFIEVVVAPMAEFTASETVILAGQSTNFISSSQGDNLTYEWYFEGGTPETSSDENPSDIFYNEIGFFDVQLIVSNEYGSDTLLMVDYIEAKPVGTIDNEENSISVFPNPASEQLFIKTSTTMNLKIHLIDIYGATVGEYILENKNNINVSNLSSGLYIISIENLDTKNVTLKKVIIQN